MNLASISLRIFAQTIAVISRTSREGLYSTRSAPAKDGALTDWRMLIASRVESPPGSGCETPGAKAGSSASTSKDM